MYTYMRRNWTGVEMEEVPVIHDKRKGKVEINGMESSNSGLGGESEGRGKGPGPPLVCLLPQLTRFI